MDEKGLKPFRVLGWYFRNIFRCRFRCVGARQRLLLGGELENETSSCCHPYEVQVYVARSFVAPHHPTEEADITCPHHPPHTATGGAGGDTIPPRGGGAAWLTDHTVPPGGGGPDACNHISAHVVSKQIKLGFPTFQYFPKYYFPKTIRDFFVKYWEIFGVSKDK